MLSFIPFYDCTEDAEMYEETGEYIFLLDRSGSMGGTRINLAKKAVMMFIKSLGIRSRFNVISFGSSFEFIFPESQLVESESVDKAIKELNGFNADMGGTDIFNPLEYVFKMPLIENYPRYLYLLTDGDVESVEQVLSLILANRNHSKIYTLGIGEANEYLIRKAAENGNGESYLIRSVPDISKCVINALEKCISPYITDVNINWDYQTVPKFSSLRNFQFGRNFCIYALLDKYPEKNPVLTCFESFSKRSLTLEVANFKVVEGEEIFKLWAKHKIHEETEDLKDISLEYQVISPLTAYFGCKKGIDGSTEQFNAFTKIKKIINLEKQLFSKKDDLNPIEIKLNEITKKFEEEIWTKNQNINEMEKVLSMLNDKIDENFKIYTEFIDRLKSLIDYLDRDIYKKKEIAYPKYGEDEYIKIKEMVFKENCKRLINKELIEEEMEKVALKKLELHKLNRSVQFESKNKKNMYQDLLKKLIQERKKINKWGNDEPYLTDMYELIEEVFNEHIKFVENYFERKISFIDSDIYVKENEEDYLYQKLNELENGENVNECDEKENIEYEILLIQKIEENEKQISIEQEIGIQDIETGIFNDFKTYYNNLKKEIFEKNKFIYEIEEEKYKLEELVCNFENETSELKSQIESLKKEDEEMKSQDDKTMKNKGNMYENEIDFLNDGYMSIVLSQKPEGFWNWNEIILLTDAGESIIKLFNATNNPNVEGTALALALLNKKYKEFKEEWILIEKKAIKWMKKQIKDYSVVVQKFIDS